MLSKIDIKGSSSSGCCYLLHFENGKTIQLDAGIKNTEHNKVNKLFISHLTHIDHDRYIKDFDDSIIIKPKDGTGVYDSEDLKYKSFVVPHKVLNNGYIIEYDSDKIAYITDCGDYNKVDIDLSNVNYLFVECNWDYFLIKNNIIIPQRHAYYAFSKVGHMSNLDCLNALAKWKVKKDCKIIFIHKSSSHANYETTYKMFESLPNKTYIARKGETLYVKSWKAI